MKQYRKAFTLLEALVASVILGGAVVGIGAVSTRCLHQAQLNRQYDTAWQLLDQQLTVIDYMGLQEFLDKGVTEGDIEHLVPTYRWQVQVESQGIDDLHLVRMTISWQDQTRPYHVSASTLLNVPAGLGAGAYGQDTEDMLQEGEND